MSDDSTVINELYKLTIQSQHFQSHCTDLIFISSYHKTANLRSHKIIRIEEEICSTKKAEE